MKWLTWTLKVQGSHFKSQYDIPSGYASKLILIKMRNIFAVVSLGGLKKSIICLTRFPMVEQELSKYAPPHRLCVFLIIDYVLLWKNALQKLRKSPSFNSVLILMQNADISKQKQGSFYPTFLLSLSTSMSSPHNYSDEG